MRQAKDLISILEEAHQVVPEELIEMANMAKNHMSSMYNTFMTIITVSITRVSTTHTPLATKIKHLLRFA